MIKREARLTTNFLKWASVNFRKTCAFEIKQTQGKSLPFSALAEHQKRALLIAKHGFFKHKIVDAGWENPFDAFSLFQVPAYVVVFFGRNFYMIDIDVFMQEKEISKRKSLTEETAKKLSTLT